MALDTILKQLKQLYPSLTIWPKGIIGVARNGDVLANEYELILNRTILPKMSRWFPATGGIATFKAVLKEEKEEVFALELNITINDNDNILVAFYNRGSKKFLLDANRTYYAYEYKPTKESELRVLFKDLEDFFGGGALDWIFRTFQMPDNIRQATENFYMKEVGKI